MCEPQSEDDLLRLPATVPLAYVAEPVFQQQSTNERHARRSLREQIARLERQSSRVIAEGFPYIAAPAGANAPGAYPRLLSFAELERLRDRLVWQLHELHHQAAEHAEHVRRSRELLEQMKLQASRYKFMRLPVRDLGQGTCGVWEVRPRLGLIGMLAGWWHVKLSSGCPLPKGRAAARPDSSASSCTAKALHEHKAPAPFGSYSPRRRRATLASADDRLRRDATDRSPQRQNQLSGSVVVVGDV
jgi:hypothetical protein